MLRKTSPERDLEGKLRLLALILDLRMNLLTLANEAAKARIDTDLANANIKSCVRYLP